MKRWILIGSGVGVVAAAALLFWPQDPASTNRDGEEAEKTASAPPSRKTKSNHKVTTGKNGPVGEEEARAQVAAQVDELLSDGSSQSWQKLAILYRGADEATKRKIVQHAARAPKLENALTYVLATVGDDFTPVDQDPMIDEAAGLLKERWVEPEDLNYGRETMLLQKSEKRQWVVAKAMITFARDIGPDSRFQPQKARLSSKLIDMHSQVKNGFIRSSIIDGMRDLGSGDVAMVLAKGPGVDLEELEVVKAERAAQEDAFKKLNLPPAGQAEPEPEAQEPAPE